MIPLYIFYSMFGFQRTGDSMWSAGDQRCRGFLIGATAGRTTLNGEGLQHQDGHSALVATTNPACVAYDPSAFEIPVIVEDALRRMYGERPEDVFYYLTVYNEPFVQPPMPEGLDEQLILQGLYRYRRPATTSAHGPRSCPRAAPCRRPCGRPSCWPTTGTWPPTWSAPAGGCAPTPWTARSGTACTPPRSSGSPS